MSAEIKIEGLDKLVQKLGQIEADKITRQALRVVGKSIIHEVSEYPHQTQANVPTMRWGNQLRWYERGYGPRWYRKRDGGIGGTKTSEILGKKWYIKGQPRQVTIGNRASYAPYVQGEEQSSVHKDIGWKRLDKTAEEKLPEITKKIQQYIERAWRS